MNLCKKNLKICLHFLSLTLNLELIKKNYNIDALKLNLTF